MGTHLPRLDLGKVRALSQSGFALALLANLIWGTSFLASKFTLAVWGPFTASALRFIIAIVGMLVAFPALGQSIQIPRTRTAWRQVFLVALFGFGLLYPLQLAGLTFIPSSLSASFMLTSPLFVLAFASALLREHLSTQKLFAIALGLAGGVVLLSPGNITASAWSTLTLSQFMRGFALTMGASVCLAFSVVVTRSASKSLDSKSLTFWSMCVGEALLLPFAFFEKQPASTTGNLGLAIAALVFLALVCSVLGFVIWNRALAMCSPQEIASTMHVKTPVAVLLGATVAGEALTLSILFGTLLISTAVWLSQWQPRPAPAIKPEGARA